MSNISSTANTQVTDSSSNGTPVVIAFEELGSLNFENLAATQSILKDAASNVDGKTVDVELRASFIGAAFVGMLATTVATLRSQGLELKLHRVTQWAREMLILCGGESWLAQ